ncbi:MAG: hypothetical protein EON54_23505 [Alcaligenaceae bacterium]|nr:MAG: hypothetical protein EON54_23505 [Alcaligenaceae bacterium]
MVDTEERIDILARNYFRYHGGGERALFRYIDGWYYVRRIQADVSPANRGKLKAVSTSIRLSIGKDTATPGSSKQATSGRSAGTVAFAIRRSIPRVPLIESL